MQIEYLIEKFLQSATSDNILNRTRVTYEKKINSFKNFLYEHMDITDNNYINLLSSISRENIIDSVAYYVKSSNIKYAETTENYFTVVRLFFLYIAKNHDIINSAIDSANSSSILYTMLRDLQKKLKLNAKETYEPLDTKDIYSLIELCNSKIDCIDLSLLHNYKWNSNYREYISGLIIKLVILTGIKNNIIPSIKLSDYDMVRNTIKINGYVFHLPNEYSFQLHNYVTNIRRKIIEFSGKKDNFDILYIDNNPTRKLDNSKMFELLKEINNTRRAQSIAKRTIMSFIQADIPSYTIMKFTGYQEVVYGHCLEMLREDMLDSPSQSRMLDSTIRSLEIFDKL